MPFLVKRDRLRRNQQQEAPPRLIGKARAVTETETRRTRLSECEQTHRPPDEEHGDCSNDGHVSDQRLQDHPHHAVKLETEGQKET